jgi:hypothetical protein
MTLNITSNSRMAEVSFIIASAPRYEPSECYSKPALIRRDYLLVNMITKERNSRF